MFWCIFLYFFLPRFFDNIIFSYHTIQLLPYLQCFITIPEKDLFGGGKENRTPDPLLAKQVLSQLSYTPKLVGLGRLELPTLRLSGVRSNHLSYKPSKGFATLIFFLKRICGRYIFSSLKGGDPAAGSPTATLLRLRPNR